MNEILLTRWSELSSADRRAALQRPARRAAGLSDVQAGVRDILARVRSSGDAALKDLTRELDGVTRETIEISSEEKRRARERVTESAQLALRRAAAQIERFHRAAMPRATALEVSPGLECERRWLPIERVGLYIPGGTAPLPSTVLMLGIPASLAGCSLRVLATPPQADGQVDPSLLAAAELCGIERIFAVGGAQAIAAMAYGTRTIPKVDKIFGPGNSWVTEGKAQVAQDPDGAAIDLPAGPSEVMVVADGSADARFVAADLLSQAEHGRDSQVILASPSRPLLEAVLREIEAQLGHLERKEIARAALGGSRFIEVSDLTEAMTVANAYAPEHLILQVKPRDRASELADLVRHAGSVFLGPWSPEAVGDYASGTNHVLPTYGLARVYGGVSVDSFMKAVTFQRLTPDALRDIGPVAMALAETEGLQGHRNAVAVRLEALGAGGGGGVEMMESVLSLARPAVRSLSPYRSARSLATRGKIFLDANESPWSPDGDSTVGLNRYPEPQPSELVSRLARLYGVGEESLFIGRGTDDAIDALVRTFCEAGRDAVLTCPPTYGVYEVAARIQGAEVVEVPQSAENGFVPEIKEILRLCAPPVKIVFLCSPNNPTGNLLPEALVESLCRELLGRAIVVLDEAYIEFSMRASFCRRLVEFPNLVCLRTLSKAWALAGARCGAALGHPEVIALLQKVRAPYPLSSPSARAVLQALREESIGACVERITRLRAERERLARELAKLPGVERIFPSEANFLLLKVKCARDFLARCGRRGILVRDRGADPGLVDCVRVSVGSEQESDDLLSALRGARDDYNDD